MTKLGAFDYINSINFGKKNMMRDTENDDLAEKGYVSFLANRSLSYFPDTILYAQEMNLSHDLDNKMQYEYLFYSVPKRKRFSKWHKKDKDEDLQTIATHYKLSIQKAEQVCSVLDDQQKQRIIAYITKTGG